MFQLINSPCILTNNIVTQLIGLEKTSTITELLDLMKNEGTNSGNSSRSLSGSGGGSIKSSNKQTISNVRPVLKNEVNVPEIKSFVAPTAKDEGEFSDIINKWQSFVESVKTEKLFGSVLNNSNPIEFLNNRLTIEVEHPEDWAIINENKNYLDKKTKEVFGKKIEFENSTEENKKSKKAVIKNNPKTKISTANDDIPLVNELINQLGAKEIKRID